MTLNLTELRGLLTDRVTSRHVVHLGVARLGATIAAQLIAGDNVGEGWIIRVGVSSEVVVLAANLLSVDDENVEDVVCVN